RDAGVVDEDVDARERGHQAVEARRDGSGIGEIHFLHVRTRAAGRSHFVGDGLQLGARASNQRRRDPGVPEAQRDGAADATPGTCDERDPAWPRRHVEAVARAELYYPRSMARAFERVALPDAVGRLRPGMKALMAPGCGDPSALVREIMRQA